MIKSLLIFSLRNIVKNRKNTVINILGLVVSLTCVLIIYHKIDFELSFDRFHSEYENTYRIVRHTTGLGLNLKEGEWEYAVGVFRGLPTAIKNEIPELKEVFSVMTEEQLQVSILDEKRPLEKTKFTVEEGAAFTEPSYFKAFDYKNTEFRWLYGSPDESLSEPYSVVISENLAEKYFGEKLPVGQTIVVYDKPFKITGLITGIPVNTDHPFQMFISFSSIEKMIPDFTKDWGGLGGLQCYVVLNSLSQKEIVEKKIKEVYAQHGTKEQVENRLFKLQPLKDIHHDTRYSNFNNKIVSLKTLVTLGLIGFFLLIMACANYANLSLARSRYRTGEVGIRKTLGGKRWHVLLQFFGESVILTSFSAIVALVFSYFAIKQFTTLVGIPLNYLVALNLQALLGLIFLIVTVSLISSSYPSLLLSTSLPVDLLRKKFGVSFKGVAIFTKSMVIVQFTISLLMIIGTITVYRQYLFLTNSDLGFEKEAVFTVPIPTRETVLMERFKSILLQNPAIKDVSLSNSSPARSANWSDVTMFSNGQENSLITQVVRIDTCFVSTYGIKLIAGRNLSLTDSSRTILINEELARQFNFKTPEEAVGKVVMLYHDPNSRVTINGVLKDYHYDTFYNKIRPTILIQNSNQVRLAGIKLAMNADNRAGYFEQLKNVLAFTENNWKSIYKNEIYEYEFLDDAINKYYINERNSSKLISVFAFITVFIACIGIFGLALYSSEQRSKEIGIRKINGAKISEILTMLNKDFVKWVAIAFIIAIPIAYYAMNKWLENFAYKTNLSWWIFALAGLLALGIAILTVSWQSWKAATRNPVEALRYE